MDLVNPDLARKQGAVADVVAADLFAASFIGRDGECVNRAKVHSPGNRAAR